MLHEYAGRSDVLVLGLPRGGVPVAFEVAQTLGVPLADDVICAQTPEDFSAVGQWYDDADQSLSGFKRFPQWMWRNTDVLDFVHRLLAY